MSVERFYELTFDFKQVGLRFNVPYARWHDSIRAEMGEEIAGAYIQLTGYVPKLRGDKTHVVEREVKYPASWWDAFKLKAIEDGNPFFDPKKIKYTVISVVHRFKAEVLYPDADLPQSPILGEPLRLVLDQGWDFREGWETG